MIQKISSTQLYLNYINTRWGIDATLEVHVRSIPHKETDHFKVKLTCRKLEVKSQNGVFIYLMFYAVPKNILQQRQYKLLKHLNGFIISKIWFLETKRKA